MQPCFTCDGQPGHGWILWSALYSPAPWAKLSTVKIILPCPECNADRRLPPPRKDP